MKGTLKNDNMNPRNLLSAQKGFGYLLLVLSILAVVYLIWLCYQRWKKIRDFQFMEETRAHTTELEDIGMDSSHGEEEHDRETKGDGLL